MGVTFTIQGLAELQEALRQLPETLRAEAQHEVEGAANAAILQMRATYPVRSGTLRDSLVQRDISSGFAAAVEIKNTAFYARWFENGTHLRHTKLGLSRGAPAKPGRVFVPAIAHQRRVMFERLRLVLLRNGLVAEGTA